MTEKWTNSERTLRSSSVQSMLGPNPVRYVGMRAACAGTLAMAQSYYRRYAGVSVHKAQVSLSFDLARSFFLSFFRAGYGATLQLRAHSLSLSLSFCFSRLDVEGQKTYSPANTSRVLGGRQCLRKEPRLEVKNPQLQVAQGRAI